MRGEEFSEGYFSWGRSCFGGEDFEFAAHFWGERDGRRNLRVLGEAGFGGAGFEGSREGWRGIFWR